MCYPLKRKAKTKSVTWYITWLCCILYFANYRFQSNFYSFLLTSTGYFMVRVMVTIRVWYWLYIVTTTYDIEIAEFIVQKLASELVQSVFEYLHSLLSYLVKKLNFHKSRTYSARFYWKFIKLEKIFLEYLALLCAVWVKNWIFTDLESIISSTWPLLHFCDCYSSIAHASHAWYDTVT